MVHDAYHKGKYYVTFKRGFEDCKKDIIITIDKVFENDSLRIILSDDDDPTFLCVVFVTRCDYEDLKRQQGLLIDFENFPSQLVRLLQQCSSNHMFLIMQQSNPVQYHFEVVEHNEFKRLVHLSLKTGPATDADIKKHMANTIANLKNSLTSIRSSLSSSEAMWNDKCIVMERKLHDLTLAVSKMEEDKLRRETEYQEALRQEKDRLLQERLQWQKNLESSTKSQVVAVQDNLMKKEKQIEDLNVVIKQQKDSLIQLENQLSDKSQRLSLLENEVQKAHIEVATTKAKNASLEREIMEKEKQCHQINLRCSDFEKTIRDNTDVIQELNNSIRILKKEKVYQESTSVYEESNECRRDKNSLSGSWQGEILSLCRPKEETGASLEDRLAISESLVNKHNAAAQSSSEQLLKANQIISKQSHDIIEMKEKLLCRTAIALEQEKVIDKNTKEIEDLTAEVSETKQSLVRLKSELESLKEKYEINKKALKDKEEIIKNNNTVIQWLHKKMEDNCIPPDSQRHRQGIMTATSSTPYFLPHKDRNETAHEMSDESINFYATSKANTEESQRSETCNAALDPKYLKPVSEERYQKTIDTKGLQKKSADTVQRGKENKVTELPKVDYREKKSARSASYRPTPVSSYFP